MLKFFRPDDMPVRPNILQLSFYGFNATAIQEGQGGFGDANAPECPARFSVLD
jgi:hypothetical protein